MPRSPATSKGYPLSAPALVDLAASYNGADAVTFTATNGDYMYLMAMVARQAQGIFKVKLSIADPKPRRPGAVTVTSSLVMSSSFGLKQVRAHTCATADESQLASVRVRGRSCAHICLWD